MTNSRPCSSTKRTTLSGRARARSCKAGGMRGLIGRILVVGEHEPRARGEDVLQHLRAQLLDARAAPFELPDAAAAVGRANDLDISPKKQSRDARRQPRDDAQPATMGWRM